MSQASARPSVHSSGRPYVAAGRSAIHAVHVASEAAGYCWVGNEGDDEGDDDAANVRRSPLCSSATGLGRTSPRQAASNAVRIGKGRRGGGRAVERTHGRAVERRSRATAQQLQTLPLLSHATASVQLLPWRPSLHAQPLAAVSSRSAPSLRLQSSSNPAQIQPDSYTKTASIQPKKRLGFQLKRDAREPADWKGRTAQNAPSIQPQSSSILASISPQSRAWVLL